MPEITTHFDGIQSSLPGDIATKIALSLQVSDVCSLGSCSRFWRELWGSDCVWESLYRDRWPSAADSGEDSSSPELRQAESPFMGWRTLYINKHNEMASRAIYVVNFLKQCSSTDSIEVGHYLTAIEDLCSMHFGFKDVQIFFLKPNLNVLLNLVGLHYCISRLGIPGDYVMEVLNGSKISERQVCVRWWKLGRWFYGFRLRDESHSRTFSLADLITTKQEEVLGVLHRGAIHEVFRVQISAAKRVSTSWSFQPIPT